MQHGPGKTGVKLRLNKLKKFYYQVWTGAKETSRSNGCISEPIDSKLRNSSKEDILKLVLRN